jgi:hypothetical protein
VQVGDKIYKTVAADKTKSNLQFLCRCIIIPSVCVPIYFNADEISMREKAVAFPRGRKNYSRVLTWTIHEMKIIKFPLPPTGEGRGEGEC